MQAPSGPARPGVSSPRHATQCASVRRRNSLATTSYQDETRRRTAGMQRGARPALADAAAADAAAARDSYQLDGAEIYWSRSVAVVVQSVYYRPPHQLHSVSYTRHQ